MTKDNTHSLSSGAPRAGGWIYAGLFLVSLATLMYEILLTRIFSVTMWYHFAFVAISIAMFGMTAGALLVYLLPRFFPRDGVQKQLAGWTLVFAATTVASFLLHLKIPFILYGDKLVALPFVVLTYAVISIPFVCGGVVICLALTRFPKQVGRLYGADLAGASLGCILLIQLLGWTDGPTAVVAVSSLVALGGFCFAVASRQRGLILAGLVLAVALEVFAFWHTGRVHDQKPLIRLESVKGREEGVPLYEKWNSFSRVHVFEDANRSDKPFAWGRSSEMPDHLRVDELDMRIDSEAGTVLTRYTGKASEIEHLKYDVTNLAHYLRPNADVLVVGAGGGRDVLSALAFDQKSVTAVELNENIIHAVNEVFGDFTGHLDEDPRVEFVHDEARSYISRLKRKFDMIQVSLIDTWAATAAGAFVLSESGFYTTDAWEIMLNHLTDRGLITFSRWYFRQRPAEMYRLVALARTALQSVGVEDPRNHLLIARRMNFSDYGMQVPDGATEADSPEGVGTILVSRLPFSPADVQRFQEVCRRMKFDVVLTPYFAVDDTFKTLASAGDLTDFYRDFGIDISPPDDNRPFFFHMLRPKDMLNRDSWWLGMMTFNMKAVAVLGVLLATVVFLTLICIFVPLLLTYKKGALTGAGVFLFYFTGIGLGFMLVEISQMQRLIVFLGHPTYGLSVVLFSILLSSSLGSAFTQWLEQKKGAGAFGGCFAALLAALVLFGLLTVPIADRFVSAPNFIRISISVLVLMPLGFFMGTAFPIGMRLALEKAPASGPWLFGVNGATSVCASVLAILISLYFGIAATFWTGVAAYVLATAAFLWHRRKGGKRVAS